ncbi:MAG: cobyric acid synthase [bacterium]|nr:cobyric acid synthase [bacterium]
MREKPLKIMLLGTGSDVGKSIIATALCRIFKNMGYRVVPFKAQNMSNNSYVTLEGGEIGRAQAAQAEAAGVAPSVHMNPVLLKPTGQIGSQVILQGKVYGNMTAKEYYAFKPTVKNLVMESYHQLAKEYEIIVIEGAGSCCEINLRAHDLVNFDLALATDSPVILIADIDRGGVFAQIIGSLEVISAKERELIQGIIINKFRGDPELFRDGITYIEQRAGKPVLGLVPYLSGLCVEKEDSLSLEARANIRPLDEHKINIAAIRLPHLSNFTDLDALEQEPEVVLNWLHVPTDLAAYDLLILPGSKNSLHDLLWLKESGWAEKIEQFAKANNKWIIGLCGGFQILGREIADPSGQEGKLRQIEGLGMLAVKTEIQPLKTVRRIEGRDLLFGQRVLGYEIHMGESRPLGQVRPFLTIDDKSGHCRFDGALSEQGKVIGTYVHGLFDAQGFRRCLLGQIAATKNIPFEPSAGRGNFWEEKERQYDLLAAHISHSINIDRIIQIMKKWTRR